MLEPFHALREAGFSRSGGIVSAAPDRWSADLIASLYWMRLVELARALTANAGCQLAGSRVLIDGSVVFGMIENPGTPHAGRALVKLASWNEWGATPEIIEQFASEVRTARNARGILIAPGGATRAAMQRAGELRVELVDAVGLDDTLASLPPEKSDFFFVVATAGDYTTPTCPVCLKKLSRVVVDTYRDPMAIESERVIDASTIIAEPVQCRRLCVAPRCEVQFLQEVRANEIIIAGDVTGDFVCDGTVTLLAAATLTGSVTARALNVEDGATMLGRTRTLEGKLEPMNLGRPRWEWRCRRPDGRTDCARVVFEPHESGLVNS
ncbi:MAG: polymer-forming cytoskeletal protein [Verrucomicrobiales bacterium]|nr:polymer-forming cytoskeletal protein [Verrucomicrobiales bacterium]